jgi:divalent metal cation (Fe/Co/Zn/Cd) transporter
MESFVNLTGATFALWMITIAKVLPDEDHPLGHSKAEYFSSGFEGILIFGAAGAIIWSAIGRLFAPEPLHLATSEIVFANLRMRRAGCRNFVYVDVLVPGQWTVSATHRALDRIEHEIAAVLPETVVFTHADPVPVASGYAGTGAADIGVAS